MVNRSVCLEMTTGTHKNKTRFFFLVTDPETQIAAASKTPNNGPGTWDDQRPNIEPPRPGRNDRPNSGSAYFEPFSATNKGIWVRIMSNPGGGRRSCQCMARWPVFWVGLYELESRHLFHLSPTSYVVTTMCMPPFCRILTFCSGPSYQGDGLSRQV